eukprot:Gregarina_sp_Poly_1__7234@NODE_397_length_8931_cov_96_456792_g325_i0_p5_GENE_NODE_397_length_8931_cov_96_456792_g325_i0NODE_397_length_8931_cov_96_456792_g325_i0_p5_ORF_typecomplete_len266_score31_42Peptidase_S26/PF10502_9/5_5e08Peptidase_S24/PF00717_23/4_4e09_NODE_397_length_8931_cov_96_456792_g325_i046035400
MSCSEPWRWGALVACSIYALRKNFHMLSTRGASMAPTIPSSGGVVFVDRYFWRLRGMLLGNKYPLKHSDIIIFRQRRKEKQILACKRVIALAGESIQTRGRGVSFFVPSRHIWVEGDRKCQSRDSRFYGAVDQSLVWGRVLALAWPTPRLFCQIPRLIKAHFLSLPPSHSKANVPLKSAQPPPSKSTHSTASGSSPKLAQSGPSPQLTPSPSKPLKSTSTSHADRSSSQARSPSKCIAQPVSPQVVPKKVAQSPSITQSDAQRTN